MIKFALKSYGIIFWILKYNHLFPAAVTDRIMSTKQSCWFDELLITDAVIHANPVVSGLT